MVATVEGAQFHDGRDGPAAALTRTARRARAMRLDLLAVAILAFGVRLAVVLRSHGGPLGDFGYDSSVYYSAADALLHGRMPYADFTLLHPPALMLVLTPFAGLGMLTSDHAGFVVANTAFELLGALNAVLVLLIARRAGVGRFAAFAGGLFYALWPGSVGAEISARLEPLGNLFLLVALLLLVRGRTRGWSTWSLLGCGALLGAAAVTKIWWAVPLVIVIGWVLCTDRRRGAFMALGATVSAAVIAGPFLIRAPSLMWRMVVLDQLGRPAVHASPVRRLSEITAVHTLIPHAGSTTLEAVLAVLAVMVLVAFMRTWRRAVMRPIVVVGVAQGVVLVAAPSYFGFYADYLAPAAALILAGALAALPERAARRDRRRVAVGSLLLVPVVVGALVELTADAPSVVSAFPAARLVRAASAPGLRCVMADSPMALIELDVLSRDLADGCQDRVDVSGSTYDVDRPPDGQHVPRRLNLRWQRDVYRYLLAGNAEIVVRHATGLSTTTRRRLDGLPVIASESGHVLRRVPPDLRTEPVNVP